MVQMLIKEELISGESWTRLEPSGMAHVALGEISILSYRQMKNWWSRISLEMTVFSDWINRHSLLDLQLNGASFTWSNHRVPPIMSRLDRFLISGEWADLYPHSIQVVLPKPTSDHCPIVLDSRLEYWGPRPFRFELMWLEEKGFSDLICSWWSDFQFLGWAGFRLTSMLRKLKGNIKGWVKANVKSVEATLADLLQGIKEIDSKEESGPLSESDFKLRQKLKDKFQRKAREEEIKWKQ